MQNLSVTVCDCTSHSSCHERIVSKTRISSGATWIIVTAILFLTATLLMAFLLTCKKERKMVALDEGFGRLITTNTEIPGTDCMVPSNADIQKTHSSKDFSMATNVNSYQKSTMQRNASQRQHAVAQIPKPVYSDLMFQRSIHRSSSRRSYRGIRNVQRSSFRTSSSYNSISLMRKVLFTSINQRLFAVQTCDEERDAYQPHCYAHEGEFIANAELDAISIAETDFLPEMLNNLNCKFNNLATISRPDLMKT